MIKDVCDRSTDGDCGCQLAQMRCVLVLVNCAILVAKYFQPQMDSRNSKNAICECV